MKKIVMATFSMGIILFSMCSETNSVREEKSASHGDLRVAIDIEKIGSLQKANKINDISLSKLVIKLLENDSLVIVDTISISGYEGITILKDYPNLTSSSNWKMEAFATDQSNMVTHSGIKDFSILENSKTDISLQLRSSYSMVRVYLNNPPMGVSQAELVVDGNTVDLVSKNDSGALELSFDYLTTSDSHNIKVRLKDSSAILYAGDTTIPVVIPGKDENMTLVLKRIGQGLSVTVDIERIGKIRINTIIEDEPQKFVPSGPWAVDSHTLALYHFDSLSVYNQFPEETGKWTAINNGGSIVPGKFSSAVSLQALQYVSMDTIIPNHTNAGTIEFYFKVNPSFNPDSVYFLVGNKGSRASFIFKDHELFFIKGHHNVWIYVNSLVSFTANQWYHIAATWGDKGMRLFLDGQLIANSSDTSDYQTSLNLYPVEYFTFNIGYKSWCCLGGIGIPDSVDNFYFDGAIDELRFSDIERY